MQITRPLVAVTFALALGLTGCGGNDGGEGDGGADKTISKPDYLEQGNAICKTGNDEISAIGETIDTEDQAAVLEAVKDQVIPNIQGQIEDLRDLGYPEGDEDTLKGLYVEADAILDSWEDDPSLIQTDTSLDAVNEQLTIYGLTECGQS